ncbi:unnamed protein product [Hermetia illucens]|uniref:Uncharacterized protein n=1 Tax=Hermetia illucens TaxID=343691 RepID=A0A7R8UUP2_HERIL|nr:unnamed protein product [Hermetia illucens]
MKASTATEELEFELSDATIPEANVPTYNESKLANTSDESLKDLAVKLKRIEEETELTLPEELGGLIEYCEIGRNCRDCAILYLCSNDSYNLARISLCPLFSR